MRDFANGDRKREFEFANGDRVLWRRTRTNFPVQEREVEFWHYTPKNVAIKIWTDNQKFIVKHVPLEQISKLPSRGVSTEV